ncbi:M48 family metallopeptidase [Gelidibacter salicanalis]|uniref:DUF45 domain-containing protein n=1 Tax=Gelidibacter salicanalis TaxID=291193 RepID=A0A934NI62_9FLAO|nr:YgjP-like metallopeptidase domain-containing protein [Gelidibacter salicanalis]MBJ7880693.1 DUF45 domain-containing protein [Gelidibacter salicanalis]
MMKDFIDFGSQRIDYTIRFSNRKTLGITVNPEMEVVINSPENTTNEVIKKKVKKKAPWILKQQSYFLSFHPRTTKRKYVSGETHLYLGRQYRLKLTPSDKNEVKYKGRFIEVYTSSKEKAETLVLEWYRLRAKSNLTFETLDKISDALGVVISNPSINGKPTVKSKTVGRDMQIVYKCQQKVIESDLNSASVTKKNAFLATTIESMNAYQYTAGQI